MIFNEHTSSTNWNNMHTQADWIIHLNNVIIWCTLMYRYHISDLRTGHVINLNWACAFVTKNMGYGKCLLCVSGPMSQVWPQSARRSTRYSKSVLCACAVAVWICQVKNTGVSDPSFQVNAQWPMPSCGCSMGWVMANEAPPHGSDPPLNGILFVSTWFQLPTHEISAWYLLWVKGCFLLPYHT